MALAALDYCSNWTICYHGGADAMLWLSWFAEYAGSWSSLTPCPNPTGYYLCQDFTESIYAFMQQPIRSYLMFNAAFHSKLDVGYFSSPTSNHKGVPLVNERWCIRKQNSKAIVSLASVRFPNNQTAEDKQHFAKQAQGYIWFAKYWMFIIKCVQPGCYVCIMPRFRSARCSIAWCSKMMFIELAALSKCWNCY